jgi:pimeloyl-ACP methyl ester carboxylesterase
VSLSSPIPWCLYLAAVVLAPAAYGAASPEQGVPGMEAHRIDEPVFNGRVVVYEAGYGNARGILLVHGIGQEGARDYREHIGWLSKSFHVIAVDLPGFGQSDKANLLYSPANYARVLRYVADRFLQRPFVLVGHSMGAVASLRYAADYPEDVQRLVVVSSAGVLHRNSLTNFYLARVGLESLPSAVDPLEGLAWLARKLLGTAERIRFDSQVILSTPEMRQNFLGGDPAKIAGFAVVSEDLRPVVPRIRAETLIIWGGKDTIAPIRTGKVLAAKLPNARLTVIERAEHEPMLQTPEAFRAALEPFLNGGLPRAAPGETASLEYRGNRLCSRTSSRVFEGEYDSLTLDGCKQVRIRNSVVRELRVLDSEVEIEDSRIGGGKIGLYARSSTILMTGGRIEGDTAIRADGSRLDLAAVEVKGSNAAVTASRRSYVVFSLSRVDSPHTHGEVHGFYAVAPKNPM